MYNYETEKPKLFTDEGQRMFLRVRDWMTEALKQTGAFRCQEALSAAGCGDSFTMLACLDRLVELKEIRRVTPVGSVITQYEVFTEFRRDIH